jgi:hypothetical protein
MPSSYTPLLRLTLPADGELVGTWGQTVNNGITSLEEAAIAGTVAVPVTDGADTVLTVANGAADQARFNTLRLTGALTAQRNVIVPAASKNYFVRNATTGGFGVQIKTAAGAGVVVPAGAAMLVYCDGVDVLQATSGGSVTVGDINGTPDLILKASGTEYMRITGGGFVAIGPVNLQAVLNVDRNQNLNTTLRIGNSSAGAASATELRLANSASATALFMNGASSADPLGPNSAMLVNASSNGVLAFGANGAERMRINPAGQVMIGTTTPVGKFSVQGAMALNDGDYNIFHTTGGRLILGYEAFTANGGFNLWVQQARPLTFGTATLERMRIDADGNVGIGTIGGALIAAGRKNVALNGTSSSLLELQTGGVWRAYLAGTSGGGAELAATTYIGLTVNGGERARITAAGALSTGVAAPYVDSGGCVSFTNVGTTAAPLYMRNNFAPAGQFWQTGPTSTQAYVVYNNANVGVYMSYGTPGWLNNSDERDKADFVEFVDATTKVNMLRAGLGRYTRDEVGTQRSFLIAQDVQAVLPSAVSVAPNLDDDPEREGFLGLCYTDVIPLLVAAIKELHLRIAALGG